MPADLHALAACGEIVPARARPGHPQRVCGVHRVSTLDDPYSSEQCGLSMCGKKKKTGLGAAVIACLGRSAQTALPFNELSWLEFRGAGQASCMPMYALLQGFRS